MFQFAPLRGAVLSCLAKKVPKEGAQGGRLRAPPAADTASNKEWQRQGVIRAAARRTTMPQQGTLKVAAIDTVCNTVHFTPPQNRPPLHLSRHAARSRYCSRIGFLHQTER